MATTCGIALRHQVTSQISVFLCGLRLKRKSTTEDTEFNRRGHRGTQSVCEIGIKAWSGAKRFRAQRQSSLGCPAGAPTADLTFSIGRSFTLYTLAAMAGPILTIRAGL